MKTGFYIPAGTRKLLLLLLVALSSCTSKKLEARFDEDIWKADLGGCNGKRITLLSQVEAIRLELLGIKEYQLRRILGQPDTEELLERSQKIYIYHMTPGSKCSGVYDVSEQTTFRVSINAMGRVTESILRKPANK